MKYNYKVGDILICINNNNSERLVLNNRYTITNIAKDDDDDIFFLQLLELKNEYYLAYRFKVDIREQRTNKLKKIENNVL